MKLKIGQIVTGKVNGIQPYGVFLLLKDGTQGLIHISECQPGFVEDLFDLFKVGEIIDAMVIDIDQYSKQISLSTRELMRPNASIRKRTKHFWTNYRIETGFEPNGKAMNGWVHEALKRYKRLDG